MLINLENRGHVAHSIHVVRRRPHSREVSLEQHLKTIMAQLMGPRNMAQSVMMQELPHHLLSEDIPCASWRDNETCLSLLRVAPHQVAEWPVMGDLLEAMQALYLVHRLYEGGESAMHRKYFSLDDCGHGEEVKHVREELPHHSTAILVLALHIEAIVLGDGPELVIAPY